jgi:carboxyl-terminal processing protease
MNMMKNNPVLAVFFLGCSFLIFSGLNSAWAGPLQIFDQTTDTVTHHFYDQTFRGFPWAKLVSDARSQLNDTSTPLQLETNINALLNRLRASHTEFLSSSDQEFWGLESVFSHNTDGAPFHQIGAWFENIDGKWFVRDVFEKSPAQLAGLLRGDEIVAVDGAPLQPVRSFESGKTKVTVSIRRNQNGPVVNLQVPIVFESVQHSMLKASQASYRVINVNQKRVGYFHLWAGTHENFKNELAKIAQESAQTTDSMILDFRDGFGGAGPDFLNPFFDHDEDGKPITQIYAKPVVVIINEGVRSGKEWISYLIRKNGRAKLVGTQTRGYFLAGQLFPIVPGQYDLFLAVATATGSDPDLERKGVMPDFWVDEPLPYSAGSDPQFDAALAWITGQSAQFPRVDADIKTYDDKVDGMNTPFDEKPSNPGDVEWTQSKLQQMVDVDQYMRTYDNVVYDHSYSPAEKTFFWTQYMHRFNAVDAADTADLKDLLKIYPWFNISKFGAHADENAWLLVQHADLDPEFQRSVLATLSSLWQKGETKPANYAYLFDRVAASYSNVSLRKLQRYGTQGMCTGPGTWQPIPIEDPAHLDERRASVGLGSESDYILNFKTICR